MWKIYKFLSSYQYAQTEGKDKSQIKVISREWTLGRLQETVDRRVHPKSATYWVTLGKLLNFLSCSVSTKNWETNTIRI